ncbi:hypothetical protein [Streptomyces mirabilis]|uniref:hypothetical protein n=1 Tax=Streptomyces mirabilis TaxID=68239 RepID=UPI00368BE778
MPHLQDLALLAALVTLAVIVLTALALDAGDELTANQAHVLCIAMKAIEHVAIAYGTALAAQDTPLTLVLKAVMPLLR